MIRLGETALTLDDVERLLAGSEGAAFGPKARARVRRSRSVIERALARGDAIYGVTTGFGKLSDKAIPPERRLELQVNLIRSHAVALGDALPRELSKLVMLLRAHSLARGYSGCTEGLIDFMAGLLRRDAVPVIRDGGSVGASGDLAPLAVLGSAMMGEGPYYGKAPRARYVFKEKEALSLINGTQLMGATIAAALVEARRLIHAADVVASMSLEALRGSARPFDPRVVAAKPHVGMAAVAAHFRRLLAASEIQKSHRGCSRVQDAYCLRCIPQVHGSVRDAFDFAEAVTLREINAAVDNPIVCADGAIISAGNFHGQSLAHAADTMGSALTTLANIAERRIERLTNPTASELPAFLVKESGLNSGFMTFQVAAAALAAECRVLSTPSSVTSIPTSAGKEDHVSMGPTSARHLRRIVRNLRTVLALEAICAAQGLEFLRPLRPGRGALAAYREVRKRVRPLVRDRRMDGDIAAVEEVLKFL